MTLQDSIDVISSSCFLCLRNWNSLAYVQAPVIQQANASTNVRHSALASCMSSSGERACLAALIRKFASVSYMVAVFPIAKQL